MANKQSIQIIFALKIKQSRQNEALSFAQLSEKTGLSISYLNEIEKGKKYPKADKILLLADALNVSYDWLVSLKLDKKYAQVSKLIRSNVLDELPLEMFGIRPTTLLELIAKAPDKLNAFLNTVIEISRRYNMSVENFYRASLRSYQEMNENYDEEIENQVRDFLEKYNLPQDSPIEFKDLVRILQNEFECIVDEEMIHEFPELQSLRTVYLEGNPARLLLNSMITTPQKVFSLSREIGYKYLQIAERAYTTRWFEAESFEQLLNHYRASYFAGALLMNKERLTVDIFQFFQQSRWNAESFVGLFEKYQVSPETLMHRMTNILPECMGIKRFFFLRLRQNGKRSRFVLDQELHFSGHHSPHGTVMKEHYCRRWLSITGIQKLNQLQDQGKENELFCGAQVSEYIDDDAQYFCLTVATYNPVAKQNVSVTLGISLDKNTKKQIRFWNKLPKRRVNSTCERCVAINCMERAEKPTILNRERQVSKIKGTVKKLQKMI